MEKQQFLMTYVHPLTELYKKKRETNPQAYKDYKQRISQFEEENRHLPDNDFKAKVRDTFELEIIAIHNLAMTEIRKSASTISSIAVYFLCLSIISVVIALFAIISMAD